MPGSRRAAYTWRERTRRVQLETLAGGPRLALHEHRFPRSDVEREVRMTELDVTFEGLSLPVTNLDRSLPFYEALGFTVEIRNGRFVLLRLGAGTLGLLEVGRVTSLDDALPLSVRALVQVELST